MTKFLKARPMPLNVLQALNRTSNPTGNMTLTVRSRRLPTTGKTYRFASSLNRPKTAGNLAASTILMNDRGLTEADHACDGSMAPSIRHETMAELTQERIKQLKARYTD